MEMQAWLDFKKSPEELRPGRQLRNGATLLQDLLRASTGNREMEASTDQRLRTISWNDQRIAFLVHGNLRWTAAGETLVPEPDRDWVMSVVAATR